MEDRAKKRVTNKWIVPQNNGDPVEQLEIEQRKY